MSQWAPYGCSLVATNIGTPAISWTLVRKMLSLVNPISLLHTGNGKQQGTWLRWRSWRMLDAWSGLIHSGGGEPLQSAIGVHLGLTPSKCLCRLQISASLCLARQHSRSLESRGLRMLIPWGGHFRDPCARGVSLLSCCSSVAEFVLHL